MVEMAEVSRHWTMTTRLLRPAAEWTYAKPTFGSLLVSVWSATSSIVSTIRQRNKNYENPGELDIV
jgi:hypothetical protein